MPKQQTPKKDVIRKDKKVREDMTEKEINKSVEDSFPASDPPGRY